MLEAATGFEPVIKVLQTFALPLGHAAVSAHKSAMGKKVGVAAPTFFALERKTGFEPATLTLAR